MSGNHYDAEYFNWQSSVGAFGGWANLEKFSGYVQRDSRVLDFGCGGGFLLKNLDCAKKVGVEINDAAVKVALENGVEVYDDVYSVPDNYVNVIISNNALEHTRNPFAILQELRNKLTIGGLAVFVVPCDAVTMRYLPGNIDRHLYSWSPMNIGNLFEEAGFAVVEARPYVSKWPPCHEKVAKIFGRRWFGMICRIYGRIDRSWTQVRIVARREQ